MRSTRRALTTLVLRLVVVSLSATGCVKATFSNAEVAPWDRHDVWLDRYLYGLIGSRDLDVRNYCGHGAAVVRVFQNGWSFSATILSLGIYSPAVASITCGAEPARLQSKAVVCGPPGKERP